MIIMTSNQNLVEVCPVTSQPEGPSINVPNGPVDPWESWRGGIIGGVVGGMAGSWAGSTFSDIANDGISHLFHWGASS